MGGLLVFSMKVQCPLSHLSAQHKKIPFIQRKRMDALIAGCDRRTAPFLQLLKVTAIRTGKTWQLEWKDLDGESKAIRVKSEKGSNPRFPRISRAR